MKVIKTEIPDVLIFEPTLHGDERGFFLETFQAPRYFEHGLVRPFVQDNLSRSRHGILRGLHLQNPRSQGKLVGVLSGRVLDVAVDVRRASPTFGRHVAVELDGNSFRQLWIPRGFAHGFAVLSESADFFYRCDELYSPADEIVVRWDDPAIGIDWRVNAPTLSARDAGAPLLSEIDQLPKFGEV
jgi:dTDP-4-dehydrorhamnose 3,5-epimerase